MNVGREQFVVSDKNDLFFKYPRRTLFVESLEPPQEMVMKNGDYVHVAWMRHFDTSTANTPKKKYLQILLTRQQTHDHKTVLVCQDALKAMDYDNPLRDPVILVKQNDQFFLKDGFHRIHEAIARGYHGRVYCIVLDMDESSDEESD